jgi:cytochrome d ubiquinol oxidase subunit I
MTAEVGRQPWLVYGLLRTTQGYSSNVNASNSLFTLLGYMGLYLMLGILFIFIMQREVFHGPEQTSRHSTEAEIQITTA